MNTQAQLIPETIGETLRRIRLQKKLSYADIAEELHIQADFIKAIEEFDQESLPSIGYVLGYVRSYAQFLGIDGSDAVARYKTDSAVPKDLGMRDQPHFVAKRNFRLPKGFFAATTMLSCAAVLAFWYGSHTDVQSASFTPASAQQPEFNPQVESEQPAANLITLKAVAPSWVEIKDGEGQVLISRIFVPGDSWQTDGKDRLTLSARDGGALEILQGNQSLGVVGNKGEPVFEYLLVQTKQSERTP